MPLEGKSAGLPPGDSDRLVFGEETDRLILANAHLSIAFSRAHGAIVSLAGRQAHLDVVEPAEAAADGALWQLAVVGAGEEPRVVTGRACGGFSYELATGQRGELRLRMEWEDLAVGAARLAGRVVVVATLAPDATSVWFAPRVELAESANLRWLALPCLGALGASDPMVEEALFIPLAGGLLVGEPRAALAPPGGGRTWRVAYPASASLQMFGCCYDERMTVWLSSADSQARPKVLQASAMPRSSRLALSVEHYPVQAQDGTWSLGYQVGIGVSAGDWAQAAQDYRAWASGQPWCSRGRGGERQRPALSRGHGLWLAHRGDPLSAVAATRELQRAVNMPVKLHWRDWHEPGHRVSEAGGLSPRGGEAAFAEAKRHLADAGVLAQLSLEGVLGEPAPDEREAARSRLASLAREAARWGFEGLCLGVSGPGMSRPNDRPGAGARGDDATADLRTMLAVAREAVGSEAQLALCEFREPLLELMDAALSPLAAAERAGLFAEGFGLRWSPIPLAAAVYHDYTTTIGPGACLVNERPDAAARLASGEGPGTAGAGPGRDWQGQFCLEVARAVTWGQQVMLADFTSDQVRNDANRRKLAFLAAVLRAQAWGVGALLPLSGLLGLLRIEAEPVEVELLADVAGTRRLVRRSIAPVLGSAWRTPGDTVAVVLVSIHSQATEFATRLRSGRLGVSLPLQLVGRTFSEDGDVPGAELRALGSEIGGRIPARSVVLLSLR